MAAQDLTSLPRVKDYLRMSGQAQTPVDDGLLQSLITRMSAWAINYCSRDFAEQTYTEQFDGSGTNAWVPPQRPVTAVASVTVDGAVVPAAQYYVYNQMVVRLMYSTFSRSVGNCVVVYTAGYAAIPDDLDQAIAELVAFAYRERDRIGVSQRTVSAETTTFIIKEGPARALAVMDRYAKNDPS